MQLSIIVIGGSLLSINTSGSRVLRWVDARGGWGIEDGLSGVKDDGDRGEGLEALGLLEAAFCVVTFRGTRQKAGQREHDEGRLKKLMGKKQSQSKKMKGGMTGKE
ncbi:hypothetical protein A0H81_08393 [Grifola frondosa]|uniref:Uncharacterized protein n=1 Tax=Grifola frondosa TaxID=5627 RepID=A0A1C7M432_GRIFR|nr:hypothetical protein A0H81_08393 [Grifola frondosa]